MTRVRPYRVPPEDAVVVESTVAGVGANGLVPGADYDAKVPISVTMRVNAQRWIEAGGWFQDAQYALRIAVVSKPMNVIVRRWSIPLQFRPGATELVAELLDAHVDGVDLSPTIQLEHALVLESPPRMATRLDATNPGAVLWQVRESFHLRGGGGAFPVEAVDFGASGVLLPKDASWFLRVDLEDLEVPTPNAVQLVLNSANKQAMGLMSLSVAGVELPPEARAIYGAIRVQLIRRALTCEDLDPDYAYPVGSIGAALVHLCRVDGYGLLRLRGLAKDYPDTFEALMHTVTGRIK